MKWKLLFLLCLYCAAQVFAQSKAIANTLDWTRKVSACKMPQKSIVFWVNDFGAVNNGSAVTTPAIQKPVDTCATKDNSTINLTNFSAVKLQL